MMLPLVLAVLAQQAPAWSDVQGLFAKHCNGCHDAKEAKGDLVLTSFAAAAKGGENGPAWVPGKPAESPLIALVEHAKKPFMPPPKKGEKLKPAEIEVLRAWIAAGAPGPRDGEASAAVVVPKIVPKVAPRKAVNALAWEAASKTLAVARLADVEVIDAATRAVVRRLEGHAGPVLDLAVAPDGAWLAAAGGVPGASGEVRIWSRDGALLRVLQGHEDAIHAVAVSPDGRLLATGSYDRDVLLWDVASGRRLRTLGGHNEAVFDVAFRPDGRLLASASADRTVKLWDVASGERRDTLTEATKALHAVAWTPDGRHVLAGGVDNRIRAWAVSAEAKEGTNPIRASVFAHEGSILAIRVSRDGKRVLSTADDRTVKLFGAAPGLEPQRVLEAQPDWPVAAAFASGDATVAVGRLDGTLAIYEAASGKAVAPPKPETSSIWPKGVERGTGVEVRVRGKNLQGLATARTSRKEVHVEVRKSEADSVWLTVTADPSAVPGPVELWVGEAGPVKMWVDDLRQVVERESEQAADLPVPSSVWGSLSAPGDSDVYALDLAKGQVLVLDLAAKRLGSKLEAVVTLSDASGRLLASNIDYEGDADPFLAYAVPADGRYVVRVSDLQYGFSAEEHFYRLSAGPLPVVTGCVPLSVPAHAESEVALIGHNLPKDARARVKAGGPGEAPVGVDLARMRVRKDLKVAVAPAAEPVETEPNDRPSEAREIPAPGGANGRIGAPGDVDLWRFEAKKGRRWVVETDAARRGSPVDTKIEILHADGRPVERVLLRAVRDSYLTFRPIDANAIGGRFWQWEEMDLAQYLYIQGEVVKLFLAPRGPDSQWDFFSLGGKRVAYFDTSATAHALDEPAYIVEPHPPGTSLPPNGLPSFTLTYANDDDAMRGLGSDSRLHFEAPADGAYLVKVVDVRDQGGERHVYRLTIREARPDFAVRLEGPSASVPAGSGKDFTVRVDRIDGFEGPVRIDVSGAPPGWVVTNPIHVDAGHFFEKGTVWAAADAKKGEAEIVLTARATIDGREVVRELKGLGTPSAAPAPKVRVFLEPVDGASAIAVEPGKETAALLRIERNGFDDRVTFDVEGLPFGVIVADIGLNGVLIPEKETERRVFLQCAPWVKPQTRFCHARAREVGNPTSPPVPFTVR